MTESFDQILELIKKTGDRLVVIDRSTENNYVVMSIKDYEHLVFGKQGLTEKMQEKTSFVTPIKEEVAQSALPLGGVLVQELTETAAPDWWEEFAEKPQVLEEKQVEDHYYLEPVES
ncbi:MAG: hypothetical protein HY981_03450 [Candidatus Magasanikbacteria bacterium]|nr:hypothetical protein [Candidatus Magasanikbacteria bacterium]